MQDFTGRLAVITGGGSGIGRELAKQLAASGCHVAICDVSQENMDETVAQCSAAMPGGTRVTAHLCDVSVEAQVMDFCRQVQSAHETDHINLLFNNAGIGGGGSFVNDDREQWDRTFGVCWNGVYFCSRAFVPLLVASDAGHIINTSSVNGFWACLGAQIAHTAYSSAKFAVKGFSEALLIDLALNAPHVKVSLVMPGHIGTSIIINSNQAHGTKSALDMDANELADVRAQWSKLYPEVADLSDEQIRDLSHSRQFEFRDNAPTTASQAADVILTGVREDQWRILVGNDAEILDGMVRKNPGQAYDAEFFEKLREQGIFSAV